MSTTKLEIGLHPVQAEFIHSKALIRGFVGGRGAGKSFVGSYDLLRRAKPGRLYMVVAPTYKVLKDASFRSFADHARNLRFLKKLNLADLRATLGNGAEVLFRSAENPDSLRGPNISGCWTDEASYCQEEAYKVVMACLREAGELGWLTATFTPKGKQHWTYKNLGANIEARRKNADAVAAGNPPTARIDPNIELFTARTKENPFLPEGFEEMLRSQYTSVKAAQELEGSFLDLGGKLFNRGWFTQVLKVPPVQARWVRFWDKAATAGGGCHTCGVLMGADYQGRFYVADIIRGQWSTFQRDEIIKMTARMDAARFNHQVRIYIEQEPGSGGIDSLRSSLISLAGFPVFGDRPSKDKRVRAEPFASQAEAGNVILVEPLTSRSWIEEFLDELEAFPDGAADQVDAAAGAFNQLTKGNTSMPMSSGGGAAPPAPTGTDQATTGGTPGAPPAQSAGELLAAAARGGYPNPGARTTPGLLGTGGGGGLLGGGGGGLLGIARPGNSGLIGGDRRQR